MAVATQLGPADLLAAPPEVFAEIVRIVKENDKKAREEERRSRLARMVK